MDKEFTNVEFYETMNKETFDTSVLRRLLEDNMAALESFEAFCASEVDFQIKVEWSHEFLDVASNKLRESKSSMDKEILAACLFSFFKKTVRDYGYNTAFLVQQCKRLLAHYHLQKNLALEVEVLEFLIQNGVIEEGKEDFHIQLDKAHHLQRKKERIKARKEAKKP